MKKQISLIFPLLLSITISNAQSLQDYLDIAKENSSEIQINNYEYELLEKDKDYNKYELTIRPKFDVLTLNDNKQIAYMENQLHHVIQRLNSRLTANWDKQSKAHLRINSHSVVERNASDNFGLIHTHSIILIHKDVETKFIDNFELDADGKRYFIKDELMTKKFYNLHSVECQPLLTDEDVKNYVGYMLKLYNDKADRDGVINDYFCFAVHPLPSNAGTKLTIRQKAIRKAINTKLSNTD